MKGRHDKYVLGHHQAVVEERAPELSEVEIGATPFWQLEEEERLAYSDALNRLSEARRHLRAVPGESEYVLRSPKLPDRRLPFELQRLDKAMRALRPPLTPPPLSSQETLGSKDEGRRGLRRILDAATFITRSICKDK